jgi:hypothetical protein
MSVLLLALLPVAIVVPCDARPAVLWAGIFILFLGWGAILFSPD